MEMRGLGMQNTDKAVQIKRRRLTAEVQTLSQKGWKVEHPKANVPSLISENAELEDQSWHNDAMPSFAFKGVEGSPFEIVLYVDYEDKNLRENEGWDSRYIVTRQNWEKGSDITLYAGNDIHAALAVTLAAGRMVQTDALNKPSKDEVRAAAEGAGFHVEEYVSNPYYKE